MVACAYCLRPQEAVVCRYCTQLHEDIWAGLCPREYRMTKLETLVERTGVGAEVFGRVMAHSYGPQGMLLYGRPGCGKSRIIWLLMKRYHDEGRSISAFNLAIPKLAFSMQVAAAFRDGAAEDWLERVMSADILWWDDFDKDKLTDRAEEMAFSVVEGFVAGRKPIFLTTNLPADALIAQMQGSTGQSQRGAAIVRRIREFGLSISIEGKGAK